MANLSIRKLDEKVYKQLQLRAIRHGVSMEEEVRCIIAQTVLAPEKISNIFKKKFGKKNGIDLKLPKRQGHDPIDFE